MSAFSRLFALETFGVKLGLENIRTLLAALDHPERHFASVLVAGTNGKGSVSAMVECALRAAGHRTGRYTSPHLVRLEERFVIDGVDVETAVLEDVVAHVLDLEAACRADGRLTAPATFFEVTTACALELFRRAGVAVAVLEVGLGGRFDATNAVEPVVTAIVSIDFDHQQHLGPSLEAIAAEKAGIARSGVPMIVGELPAAASDAVDRVCRERGAPLVAAAEGTACLMAPDGGRWSVQLSTQTRDYGPVTLGLAGEHQVGNALVAVRILEALDAEGIQIDRASVETGLADARWPGRLDLRELPGGRAVLLDAAHNPAGARTLARHLRHLWSEPVPLVFGVSADKDAEGMLAALAPVVSTLIATEFGGPRARSAADLADRAGRMLSCPVVIESRVVDALRHAWTLSPRVAVAGSLFLLGELLPHLTEASGGPPAAA
ncbi:MAG TPA: folylpolyglutamate synthase/dihydrofolate synthase family protein [Vicinamibacterales bacterium]